MKILKLLTKKLILGILAIIIIGVPVLYLTILNQKEASASWMDEKWLYRQKVEITNSGSAQTDYQVQLTLDTQTLEDAGKILSNCNDLRVTDINGRPLPFWIEASTCSSSATKIWVKVPSIPTSGQTLYLYYGNPSASSASVPSPYPSIFLREIAGVVGAWNLEETASPAADSSGNENSGTWAGHTTNTTGKFGNGATFDGTGDYINAGNGGTLAPTSAVSISMLMKTTTRNSNRYPLCKSYDGNSSCSYGLRATGDGSNSYLGWSFTVGTTVYNNIVARTYEDDAWHYVVATFDKNGGSNNLKLYFDGSVINQTTTVVNDIGYGGYNFHIGAFNGGLAYNGAADDVRVYNKALTQAEITDLNNGRGYVTTDYTAGKELVAKYSSSVTVGSPGTETQGPGPVGFWSFNDGQGQTAQDSSSSNNDGTLGADGNAASDDPTWQPEDRCVAEKCLFFDGGDYVNTGLFINTSNNFTLSGWAKVKDKSVQQSFFGVNDNDTNRSYIGLRDGKYWAGVGDTQRYTVTASAVTNNTWFHWMLVANGGTAYYYINGIQVDSFAYTGVGLQSTWTNKIGAVQDSSGVRLFTTGFIDEVKVYPYARSAAQVKTDYNAGKGNASAHTGTGAVLGSQTQDFLSNGLVGYWKMDESSGDLTDSSGNSNTETVTGTTVAAGKFGNGRDFNGTSDFASKTSAGAFDFDGEDFTVSAWVNSDQTSGDHERGIVEFSSNSDSTVQWALEIDNDTYQFHIDDNGGWGPRDSVAGGDVSSGWQHIVATHKSGQEIKLYINGSLVKTDNSIISDLYNPASPTLVIGRWNQGSPYFDGKLDEIRIYNRTLSSKEVSDLYNWAPGPVGYWDFEEGGSLGVGSTAADRSGNNYAGTWSGTGKHTASGKFGKAGSFNGTDDIVSVDHNSTFNFSGQFSVGAWVYPKAVGSVWRGIVNHRQSVDNLGWELKIHSTTNKFVFYDSSTDQSITGDSAISTNQWYYVMATRDSSNVVRMYVNGVLQADSKTYASMSSTSYPLRFGIENNGGVNVFEGQIDEVKIYNYARTQKQIVSDMNGDHPNVDSPVGSAIGHWKFDEGQGTVANNSGSVGSTLNGTLTTMASPATATSGWTQSGKFNKGLIFDGSDDLVTLSDPSSGALDPINISVSAWVYRATTSSRYERIIEKWGDDTGQASYMLRVQNNGKAAFYGSSDGLWVNEVKATSTTTVGASSWYHLVGVYDGANVKIYVNGILEATTALTGNLFNGTSAFRISSSFTDEAFNGTIDEVKVYNYALTADEVKTDYNKGSSMVLGVAGNNSTYAAGAANQEYCVPGDSTSCAPPVGRWNFEEGKDNTCSGGTNDVCDTSGNANNGAWNGTGSHWSSGKIGKAGKFNGSDDYVATGNYNESANQAFSASAWIKLNATQNTTGVFGHKVNGVSGWLFGIGTTNNIPTFYTGTTGVYLDAASAIPVGQWTHIEITYDGTNRNIYVNGQLSAGPSAGSFGANNVPFTIGRFHSNESANHFNGQIDQVRYFNYARSAAQVAWDYNRGAPVGHWKFDECQGNSAKDSSGNNNHGTITIGASGEDALGTCTTSSTAWGSGATGKRNASLKFDGTDDRGTATLSKAITGATTLSAWVYITEDNTSWQTIFGSNDNDYGMLRFVSTNCVAFTYTDNNACATISKNTWHHLVGVFDGTYKKLYIDGVFKNQLEVSGHSFSDIDFGSEAGGATTFFNGQIDDTRVYNYALTATQIKDLYNGGAVNFGPSTGSP